MPDMIPRHPDRRRAILTSILLAAALAASPLSAGAQEAADASAQVPARAVRLPAATVVEAAIRPMTETVPINGSLVARETVAVMAQVTGYQIVDVEADVGSQVEKGEVLVRLDRAPLETQLKQAEAEIASAEAAIAQNRSQIAGQEATLTQATSVIERARTLVGRGAGTQSALDDATTGFAGAVASLQAAKDALASAEAQADLARARRDDIALQLQRTEVVAPVGGIVATRSANIGQTAGTGDATAMFTLIKDGEIEFDGLIIETALPKVRPGQKAVLKLSGYADRGGTVRLLSPNVDPTTRLGSVKIALDAPEMASVETRNTGLPIGIFASAVVTVAERDAVAVPLSAVVPSAEGSTVQVVDRDGTIDVRIVETGIVESEFVEIVRGLDEGETVVAKSGPFFRDGMRIKPVPLRADPAVSSNGTPDEAAALPSGDESGPEAVAR